MPVTLNVVGHNKKYGLEYKMVWEKEFDFNSLPKISLKTPIEQAQKTWKIIYNFMKKWAEIIKEKLLKQEVKHQFTRKRVRKFKNLWDFQGSKNWKKHYKELFLETN